MYIRCHITSVIRPIRKEICNCRAQNRFRRGPDRGIFFRPIFGWTFLAAISASRIFFGGFSADKNPAANPAIGYGWGAYRTWLTLETHPFPKCGRSTYKRNYVDRSAGKFNLSCSAIQGHSRSLEPTLIDRLSMRLWLLIIMDARSASVHMLYFAAVFFHLFFMAALVGQTAERIFTKLSHVVDIRHHLRTY